jgi:hypothetical protein
MFLHFNGKLMKKQLGEFLEASGYSFANVSAPYFIDAALDTTFISNIVNYFKVALNCSPLDWNKYIQT